MFDEFEKATGIKVNWVRFSPGEALARVIAEKNNPRVDVLFGGPVETFAAGIGEGVFEAYKPPRFGKLPERFRHADGQWIAIADDPLVFMTNQKFLTEHKLKPPASWNDLLNPAYRSCCRCGCAALGHRVTPIFSILESTAAREHRFAYRSASSHVSSTPSGGRGTLPSAWVPAADHSSSSTRSTPAKATTSDLFPSEGIERRPRASGLIKGAKTPTREEADDWGIARCSSSC